jgi:prepilin-type N-terminal cleavage/methylation domain-containing protein
MKRCRRPGHVRRSLGKGGFTLVELMIVIAIIFTLAALLMAAGDAARRTAKNGRSNAILDMLATACERYWAQCHDYPYPNPDYVGGGLPGQTLGNNAAFRKAPYFVGGVWTDEGLNVALVYILSQPQTPEPLINTQQTWFKIALDNAGNSITGPDGIRKLFKVVDGFGNVIKVARLDATKQGSTPTSLDPTTVYLDDASLPQPPTQRRSQQLQVYAYIWVMSAGADGQFGDYDFDKHAPRNDQAITAKDNLSRYVRR